MGKKRAGSRKRVIVYGTSWCPQSGATRRFLDKHGIRYRYVDIDEDAAGAKRVLALADGHRSVPTLVLPDQRVLVEPGTRELERALGLSQPARRRWWPFRLPISRADRIPAGK